MMANDMLQQIESDAVRKIVKDVLVNHVPKYFFHAAASSTGKYHPSFSLGDGGLLRHSIVVAYFASRIADAWGCTQHEKDIVIGAALIHDGLKHGEKEGFTVHEHPALMAALLRKEYSEYPEAEELAHVVESHMGRWNTSKRSSVVLPTPQDKLQYLLSAADMISATRELRLEDGFFEKELAQ